MIERLYEARDFIKSKTDIVPDVAIVLGSGLGDFADLIKNPTKIPYGEIPGFFGPSVEGHAGQLVIGNIGEAKIAVMQGRVHAYEGHSIHEVVFPTRVLGLLGAKTIILTNASGGVNREFSPGQLVLIKDHINLTGANPLVGKNLDELGSRFPDMTHAYNREVRSIISQVSEEIGQPLKEGVYCGFLGPSYETPAEINMARVIGADLVGMSTVCEAIAANHMGMKVAAIGCVTNMAAGIEDVELKHDDVKIEAAKAKELFCQILEKSVIRLI